MRLPFNRYVLFFSLAIIGVSADLISKTLIFNALYRPELNQMGHMQNVHWLLGEFLGIQCSTNPGALFGFAPGYSSIFAVISVVAIGGILIWLFWFNQAFDRWMTFAFGLITGGILGNLYDRLGFGFQPGYPEKIRTSVRDWIYFQLNGVPGFDPWPNFNIADSLLVTGAVMLFIHAFVYSPTETGTTANMNSGQV